MRAKNPVVALDLDGVLLDFEAAWIDCARRVLRRNVYQVSEQYPLDLRYSLSKEETEQVFRAFEADACWERVPLYPQAWDLIESLDALRVSVFAVTNVSPRWTYARALSLQGAIPEGRILCLGSEATPAQRASVLRNLGATAFLDDLPENVNAALITVPAAVHLQRGYQGQAMTDGLATVIDHLLDFPEVIRTVIFAQKEA